MIYFIAAGLIGFAAGVLVTLTTGAFYCMSQMDKKNIVFETPSETDSKQ